MNGRGVMWLVAGAAVAFVAISLATVGLFLLPPVLVFIAFLAFRRVTGPELFLVGCGGTFTVLWLALVQPYESDQTVVPLVVAILVFLAGVFLAIRGRHHPRVRS